MASFQHTIVKQAVSKLIEGLRIRQTDIPFIRRVGDNLTSKLPLPSGTSIQSVSFQQFDGEWIRPANARRDFVLLYIHGGGYVMGSAKTHRAFVARLLQETGIRAFSVNYRLAPECPFPAALDDVLETYHWLREQGYAAEQIFVGGDSAGGGLSLALLLALREMGEALPLAVFCIAPWTDLQVTGDSIWQNKQKDAFLEHFDIPTWAKMYYRDYAPTHPLVSPLYADLHGLPPILIQVSEDEVLRDDTLRLAWKLKEAGVEVEVQKWKGLIHVWQMFWQYVPEAKDAISQLSKYMKDKMELGEVESAKRLKMKELGR